MSKPLTKLRASTPNRSLAISWNTAKLYPAQSAPKEIVLKSCRIPVNSTHWARPSSPPPRPQKKIQLLQRPLWCIKGAHQMSFTVRPAPSGSLFQTENVDFTLHFDAAPYVPQHKSKCALLAGLSTKMTCNMDCLYTAVPNKAQASILGRNTNTTPDHKHNLCHAHPTSLIHYSVFHALDNDAMQWDGSCFVESTGTCQLCDKNFLTGLEGHA